MLWWVLLWVVLFLAAGASLGLLALQLWRKAKALTREIGEASERLTAVLAALNDVAEPPGDQPPPSPATGSGRGDLHATQH
jgi:hypothetical protein